MYIFLAILSILMFGFLVMSGFPYEKILYILGMFAIGLAIFSTIISLIDGGIFSNIAMIFMFFGFLNGSIAIGISEVLRELKKRNSAS